MFIGHFAVAFAAKRLSPTTSLGTLFAASQLVDLLWPLLLLLGVEHVRVVPGITTVTPLDFYDYPITHSLVGSVVWSVLFAGLVFWRGRNTHAAIVVGCVTMSHWILNLIMHRPDLPLLGSSSTKVGFGVWNSYPLTLMIEMGLFVAGVVVYMRATASDDKIGRWGLFALIAFLVTIYAANVFGPPPPSEQMIAIAGNATWIIVLWGWWIDRHRHSL